MTSETKELKDIALYYRDLLKVGAISIVDSKIQIMPYINKVNLTSKELAKKHGLKCRAISFSGFVR